MIVNVISMVLLFCIFLINIFIFIQLRQAVNDLILNSYINTGVEYEGMNDVEDAKKQDKNETNNKAFYDMYEWDEGVEIIEPIEEFKAEIRRLYGGDVD
ncbi:MAG: hypothetical protein PHY47_12860 [Lachnospiraceae bacterium]|nr:hypothetical protein [Lachnospiraceae bacterium]